MLSRVKPFRRPRLSTLTRPFTHPSSSRLAPAAALAEVESDESSYQYHTPIPQPQRASIPHVIFPSPLPSDVPLDRTHAHASLYPSTGVLDQLSLISICLRRPEHVPRAYQIFKQFIETPSGDSKTLDADVWGRVIEGVASLGKGDSDIWRRRAHALLRQWNEIHGVSADIPAGLEQGGIRIYQGYLAGLLR